MFFHSIPQIYLLADSFISDNLVCVSVHALHLHCRCLVLSSKCGHGRYFHGATKKNQTVNNQKPSHSRIPVTTSLIPTYLQIYSLQHGRSFRDCSGARTLQVHHPSPFPCRAFTTVLTSADTITQTTIRMRKMPVGTLQMPQNPLPILHLRPLLSLVYFV